MSQENTIKNKISDSNPKTGFWADTAAFKTNIDNANAWVGLLVLVGLGLLFACISGMVQPRSVGTISIAAVLVLGVAWGCRVSWFYQNCNLYFNVLKGRKSCSVQELAAATEIPPEKILKDLHKIARKNLIQSIVLSEDDTQIFCSGIAQQQQEEHKKQLETPHRQNNPESAFLRELWELKEKIQDPVVLQKTEKIYELVENIVCQAKELNLSLSEIQHFQTYYLPTTLKLLHVYTQVDDQPQEGKNIQNICSNIPATLDTLIEAYQNILDSLYKNVAVDVMAEIKVLEDTLKQQGLVKNQDELTIPTKTEAKSH